MTKFAFVIHPIVPKDVARKYPIAKYVPDAIIEKFLQHKRPVIGSYVTGIHSPTGAETEGWLIACPLTPSQMMGKVPLELVYERIVQCTDLAAERGAQLIGLGAFTSVVGDGGLTVASRSKIPVTTGNSYTIATACEGALVAAGYLDIDVANATLAVVGATGSIGKTCAIILGKKFGRVILIGRDEERTALVALNVQNGEASTDISRIREADVIVTVSSAGKELVLPEHLRPGAIVCDVARPRDVSARVARERPDVLVIEGGVIAVPGDAKFNFNFGFPKKTAYACMSETIILALENRPESFTLGKDVSVEKVEEIARLAVKHGFKLASFRAFEREVGLEAIDRARKARFASFTVPRDRALS